MSMLLLTTSRFHESIVEVLARSFGSPARAIALLGPATTNTVAATLGAFAVTRAIVVLRCPSADAADFESDKTNQYKQECARRNIGVEIDVVAAVSDVETWLFADQDGLTRALGGQTDATLPWNAVETISDPVAQLRRLLAPRSYVPRVAGELAVQVDVVRAVGRSRSLARFQEALRLAP